MSMQGENIMQGQNLAGADGRSPEQRELAELKEAMERQKGERVYHPMENRFGPPLRPVDHEVSAGQERFEAANPAYTFPKDAPGYANMRRDDTPDHLRVSSMVNILATDTRLLIVGGLLAFIDPPLSAANIQNQLLEEITELRARLSPILSEQKQPPLGNPPNAPVHCRMAAELGDVLATLQQARQLVSVTLSQLDL